MRAYVEEVRYINQNGYNIVTGGAYPFFYSWEYGVALKYCYYVPLKQGKIQIFPLLNSYNFDHHEISTKFYHILFLEFI